VLAMTETSADASGPDNRKDELRTGFTTGTCAAAAAKAATILLSGGSAHPEVDVGLPDGTRVSLPVERSRLTETYAEAGVRKDAGADPDVTDGVLVTARVMWIEGDRVTLAAGDGVGTVTKPGLSVPPGEPAINPVPRRMITSAVREVTDRGIRVVISIPGGLELAEKTFNPRLGVEGGLSILGTSGIVRPFSSSALRDALKCSLDVAVACKVTAPVFVPGRIGQKAAQRLFQLPEEQLIEVSNEWGFMLDLAAEADFRNMLVLGHPGKLAKLPAGWWDTHSSRSGSAVPFVAKLAERTLGHAPQESRTVEGLFSQLPENERPRLADALAAKIAAGVRDRIKGRFACALLLVNLKGEELGRHGDLTPWE
jgi:cobalt-precorrin-5B (C1)-methyltransferase